MANSEGTKVKSRKRHLPRGFQMRLPGVLPKSMRAGGSGRRRK